MSRFAIVVRFVRAGSTTKRTRLAHLAGLNPFEVATPVEPTPVIHLDHAAWHTRLTAANRKAA